MSQFDADPFLQQIAAGVGNLEVARRNYETKANVALQGQAMRQQAQMQQNELAAGAQMQQQKLASDQMLAQQAQAAETANYAALNASRERISQQEMAQQASQFERAHAQNKELFMAQQLIIQRRDEMESLRRQRYEEMIAMAPNDPNIVRARSAYEETRQKKLETDRMLNTLLRANQLATEGKKARTEQVGSRIRSLHDAATKEQETWIAALGKGFEMATLQDARNKQGFFGDVERQAQLTADADTRYAAFSGPAGRGAAGADTAGYGLDAAAKVALFNFLDLFGYKPEEAEQIYASDFQRSPFVMASAMVNQALDAAEGSHGLPPGKQAEVKPIINQLLMAGALLSGVDVGGRDASKVDKANLRSVIRDNVAQLRQAGFGNAKINGILKQMESMAANQLEMSGAMGVSGIEGQVGDAMARTMSGLGAMSAAIQGVVEDDKFMADVGGPVEDLVAFNLPDIERKAALAWGMGGMSDEGPTRMPQQLAELVQGLKALGAEPEEINEQVRLLTEMSPELRSLGIQDMRPEEIQRMIDFASQQGTQLDMDLGTMAQGLESAKERTAARGKAAIEQELRGRMTFNPFPGM